MCHYIFFEWGYFFVRAYFKDKRIENAVVEVIKEIVVLDKHVINCLLESISETVNQSVNQVYTE